MRTPRTRRRLAYVMAAAALAAGALIAADVVPQRARAEDSAQAAQQAGAANRCDAIPPGFGHPPVNNLTPVTLQPVQRSIEPVPATDGLIHLAYAAQVTNTRTTPADITGVVPVDPLADFSPTGQNFVTDDQGHDVTGAVRLFATPPDDTLPVDGPGAGPVPPFFTRVPAGNLGLMFFDVTYTDPARIPQLLSHAITVTILAAGGPSVLGLTDPVPVGCRALAILHPPLVGHGWLASNGCCTFINSHRGAILPVNGVLQAPEQFAIDYVQLGPNDACCSGPPQALRSWWGYDTPILAAAPGVVVEVVDGMPDQQPVGTIMNVTPATAGGNSVLEDIGSGRFVAYGHLKPGTIPAGVRKGTRLRTGDLIGRLDNSGNSDAPHLHFQVMDGPSFLDATGLPFVFDTQLLEGRAPESAVADLAGGAPVPIDRTGAGLRRELLPADNGVFGYNLSK
jgi:Peptidase family M23